MMTKEQILAEAKALQPKVREELIEDLRQIADDGVTPQQLAEIRRRIEAVDGGEMATHPGEAVMHELHDLLRRQ
jgi:hypothetical protein